jgi:type IV fimbrial biogenesis protein FimT
LVELLTVVTIVGVLAAIAGPPFFEFIVQQRLRNAAYDLIADLTFARSEAVKRNSTVTVAKVGTWTSGWTVKDAVLGTTLRQHPAFSDTVTITMGATSLDFNRDGRASPASSFVIDDTGGKATIAPRYVCVDASGRPRSTTASCT